MLELFTIFGSSFIIALSGAMMPGTLLTVTISESSRRGSSVGPLLILGHAILELALLVALVFGLAPLFGNRWFFIGISIVGGIILLWMATGMIRSLPTLTLFSEVSRRGQGNLVLTGILMSMANPYWIIWWATIGVKYIAQSKQSGFLGISFFFAGHILADLSWYTFISTTIGKGRRFFSNRIYKGLIGVCAAALVFFGCYFLFSAYNRFSS
jgi:threonine/homoserine/homoserine lactone efflux protein